MEIRTHMKKRIKDLYQKLDPRHSLKRLLSVWFILFALVPLLIIVSYSAHLYNKRINDELIKRLTAFEAGIDIELNDVEEKLRLSAFRHANDYYLMNLLHDNRKSALETVTQNLIENFIIDRIGFYTSTGKLYMSVKPKRVIDNPEAVLPDELTQLPPHLKINLEKQRQIVVKNARPAVGFSFDCFTLMKSGSQTIGYLQETVIIDRNYSVHTKERTGLDICLFDKKFNLMISTLTPQQEILFHYPSVAHHSILKDVTIEKETHIMLTKAMKDDEENIYGYFGILVSRSDAKKTLVEIMRIFIFIVLIIFVIVIIFTQIASRTVLHPIEALLKATRSIKKGKLDQSVAIPKMYEIGSLVHSFNNMSATLFRMKNELEEKVKELHLTNLNLKRAQVQLVHSSKMVSLGQLVAGVAHELNNPIGYTYSNIHHLKEYQKNVQKMFDAFEKNIQKLPENDQEKIKKIKKELNIDHLLSDMNKIIESSLEGIEKTKEIVIGLRNFSRLDEAETKIVDIHEGIESTLKLLTNEMSEKITVHKNFGKIPKINCYSSQLNQVFMNLLSNAIQAIPRKGDIWIATMVVKDQIHITIKDNGIGISQENLSRIFDPFFTTKKIGEGTGLGLSIAYGIIEKHKGTLKVKSELGKGSIFTIILPKNKIDTQ